MLGWSDRPNGLAGCICTRAERELKWQTGVDHATAGSRGLRRDETGCSRRGATQRCAKRAQRRDLQVLSAKRCCSRSQRIYVAVLLATVGSFSTLSDACPAGQCSTGSTCCTLICGDCDNCVACAAGSYCSSSWPGDDERAKCNPSVISGGHASSLCPAGKFSLAGATACTACTLGKYSARGAGACINCAAGRFAAATGTETCTNCAVGYSQANQGQASCTVCPSGKYGDTQGMLACIDCERGKYAPAEMATSCIDCDRGTHQPGTGQSARESCQDCAIGRYHDISNDQHHLVDTPCTLCPAGRTTERTGRVEEDDIDACNACLPGTYGTLDRRCLDCRAGQYSTRPESTGCIGCTVCTEGVTYEVATCLAGSVHDRTCAPCSRCSLGATFARQNCTVTSDTVCESCAQCSAGVSFEALGCTIEHNRECVACSTCGLNEFESRACAPASNSVVDRLCTACVECGQGQFETRACDSRGDRQCSNCLQCGDGQYETVACSPRTDRQCAACGRCISGLEFQTVQCTPYQNAQCATCQTCSPGYYMTADCTDQDRECAICSAGKYQSAVNSNACIDCRPGRTSPEAATSEAQCEDVTCAAGQFFSLSESICRECQACAAGTEMVSQCSRSADAVCTACPMGKYGLGGDSTCIGCDRGTARSSTGGTSKQDCLLCDTGTFPATAIDSVHTQGVTSGAAYCVACPPGQHGALQATPNAEGGEVRDPGGRVNGPLGCATCAAGQFQRQFRQTTCTECRQGQYAASTGATECQMCSEGRSSVIGSELCTGCSPGTFAERGASSCQECPDGQYQLGHGQASCIDCGLWCHEHGSCSAVGECDCDRGFTGARCESATASAAATLDAVAPDNTASAPQQQPQDGPWAVVAAVLAAVLALVGVGLLCSRKKDPLGIQTSGFNQDTAAVASAATLAMPKATVVPSETVTSASIVHETQDNPLERSASAVLAAAVQRERQRQHEGEQASQGPPV